MSKPINIFFIGDINGKPGLSLVSNLLKQYLQKYAIDLCIANGENCTEGKGISEKDANTLFELGVHVITTGNHLWDRWESKTLLAKERRILRPLNYPRENPGNGFIVHDLKEKGRVGVLNLQGRTYMQTIDDPFKAADWAVSKILNDTKVIFVDMHAEATSEKNAMGWHLDGRASVVFGTHTHVQTADDRVLPDGTAYITDVGMCGPFDSVIGMAKETVIRGFMTQLPRQFEVAEDNVVLQGIVVDVDEASGKARAIRRLRRHWEAQH